MSQAKAAIIVAIISAISAITVGLVTHLTVSKSGSMELEQADDKAKGELGIEQGRLEKDWHAMVFDQLRLIQADLEASDGSEEKVEEIQEKLYRLADSGFKNIYARLGQATDDEKLRDLYARYLASPARMEPATTEERVGLAEFLHASGRYREATHMYGMAYDSATKEEKEAILPAYVEAATAWERAKSLLECVHIQFTWLDSAHPELKAGGVTGDTTIEFQRASKTGSLFLEITYQSKDDRRRQLGCEVPVIAGDAGPLIAERFGECLEGVPGLVVERRFNQVKLALQKPGRGILVIAKAKES